MDDGFWNALGKAIALAVIVYVVVFMVVTQHETAVNTQKILNILED